MNNDEINNIYQKYFKQEKKNSVITEDSESEVDNSSISSISRLSDKEFEKNIRNVLEKELKLLKIENKILSKNKEFKIFKMELYERKTKNLIQSNTFNSDEEYYYLKENDEYFFIRSDNLSKLYYHDNKNNIQKTVKGLEEGQILDNAVNFYFNEKEVNNNNNIEIEQDAKKETFFDDIKFNLISSQTISVIGSNNNISKDYLDGYYVKARLLSNQNKPYGICLDKGKEFQPGDGKLHYPNENYYVKLTSISGQFDGTYRCSKEINLSNFGCEIITKNFDKIPENNILLFEFKNGKGGENKIISQAIQYQKNAKILFRNEVFYHIIIVRSQKLGKQLIKKIRLIKEKNFSNFAILCLNNKLNICNCDICDNRSNTLSRDSKKDPKRSNNSNNSLSNDIQLIKEDLSKINELFGLVYELKCLITKNTNDIESIKTKINMTSNKEP